jgi:hypothetical protein
MCPQCAYIRVERWLEKYKARLLACDHYHTIFTIPDELNDLWLANVKPMTELLFTSVRDTLVELLGDDKYMGALPGIIAALHTWGQTLVLHPHIHCLVTGGGLSEMGQWKGTRRKKFLIPSRVVMKVFRGKFLDKIRRSAKRGGLRLPEGMSLQRLENRLNKLGRVKWNVYISERYGYGEGVLIYLARYLKGGPISNKRLIKFDGQEVVFKYVNNREADEGGEGKRGVMRLEVEEFIRRWLLHVPEPGSQMVRFYGLYGHRKKEELERSREELGQGPVEEVEELDWQRYCAQRGEEHPERCKVCGRWLVCVLSWPKGGAPPGVMEMREKEAA